MRIVPGSLAGDTGRAVAGWREALKAETAALEVDSAQGFAEGSHYRKRIGKEVVDKRKDREKQYEERYGEAEGLEAE